MIDLHTFIDKLLLRIIYVTWEWLPINLKFCAIDHHNLHCFRFMDYRLVCIVLSISSFPTWEWLPNILKFCPIDRLNLLCYRFIDVWLIAYKLTALAIGISRWKHLLRLLTLQWTMTLPSLHTHTTSLAAVTFFFTSAKSVWSISAQALSV